MVTILQRDQTLDVLSPQVRLSGTESAREGSVLWSTVASLVCHSNKEVDGLRSSPAVGSGERLLDPFDFCQAFANPLFHSFIRRTIVHAVAETVGQALHVGDLIFGVVGVLIVLAVAEAFHQAGRGVAQVERDGLGSGLFYILLNRAVGGVKRVRFWRDRQIHDRLRESQ